MLKKSMFVFSFVLLFLLVGCGLQQNDHAQVTPATDSSEHWSVAKKYMDLLEKPVADVCKNYTDWIIPSAGFDGGAYFQDSETNVLYIFDLSDLDISKGMENLKLAGHESISEIAVPAKILFPDAQWPANSGETAEYLREYLSVSNEWISEPDFTGQDDYDQEAYYTIMVPDDLIMVRVYVSESNLIEPETYIDFKLISEGNLEYWLEQHKE